MSAEHFRVYPSGPKFVLVALSASILIVAGVWVILNADKSYRYDPHVAQAIGGICTLFSAAALIELFLVMAAPGPLIAIGPDGVVWRFWSERTIPWNAIERIQVRRSAVQSHIALQLINPADHPPRAQRLPIAVISRLFGYRGIPLSNKIADCAFEPMLDAMKRHAPALFTARP